jgi:mercuric ion binding protein
MKSRYSLVVILLIMMLPFAVSAQEATAESDKATVVIKTKIYCDHCIQCEDCNANIMNKVRAMNKGIKKVKVNPAENTITVTYHPGKTDIESIRKAINTAGFDADDQPAPAEAVAKLDGCCRKK